MTEAASRAADARSCDGPAPRRAPSAPPVLVFDDTLLFGGHERMFLALAPAIRDVHPGSELVFCLPERNERLAAAVEAAGLEGVRLVRLPFAKGRGEPYRAPLRLRYRAALRRLLHREAPALAIILQGRVESTLVPLIEARAAGVPTLSYLPMAHPVDEIRGGGALDRLAERSRRPYYARPDLFVVPTRVVARQLRRAGVRAPIHVVPNVIEMEPATTPRAEARRRLDLPQGHRLALVMGRVDRHQKGLDLLVERIAGCSMPDWNFVVVGDGPDRGWLDDALARRAPAGRVHRIGWTDAPQDLYRACDVVLLPSRFEGLPLVVLEALLHRRPVVASPIEAHADLLPERALTSFADQAAFEATLGAVAAEGGDLYADLYSEAPQWRNIARSRALFRDALSAVPAQR